MDPEAEHYTLVEFAISNGLCSFTELQNEMNIMDLEHLIHAHVARKAREARIERARAR